MWKMPSFSSVASWRVWVTEHRQNLMYDLVDKSQLTEMAANSKPNSRNQDYSIRRQKGKFLHGKFLVVTLHGKDTNKRYGGRHAD